LDRVYQHPRESLATHGGPLICWRWSIVPHELAGNFARNNIVNSPSCSLFVCSKTNLRKLTKNLREEKLSYALTNFTKWTWDPLYRAKGYFNGRKSIFLDRTTPPIRRITCICKYSQPFPFFFSELLLQLCSAVPHGSIDQLE